MNTNPLDQAWYQGTCEVLIRMLPTDHPSFPHSLYVFLPIILGIAFKFLSIRATLYHHRHFANHTYLQVLVHLHDPLEDEGSRTSLVCPILDSTLDCHKCPLSGTCWNSVNGSISQTLLSDAMQSFLPDNLGFLHTPSTSCGFYCFWNHFKLIVLAHDCRKKSNDNELQNKHNKGE